MSNDTPRLSTSFSLKPRFISQKEEVKAKKLRNEAGRQLPVKETIKIRKYEPEQTIMTNFVGEEVSSTTVMSLLISSQEENRETAKSFPRKELIDMKLDGKTLLEIQDSDQTTPPLQQTRVTRSSDSSSLSRINDSDSLSTQQGKQTTSYSETSTSSLGLQSKEATAEVSWTDITNTTRTKHSQSTLNESVSLSGPPTSSPFSEQTLVSKSIDSVKSSWNPTITSVLSTAQVSTPVKLTLQEDSSDTTTPISTTPANTMTTLEEVTTEIAPKSSEFSRSYKSTSRPTTTAPTTSEILHETTTEFSFLEDPVTPQKPVTPVRPLKAKRPKRDPSPAASTTILPKWKQMIMNRQTTRHRRGFRKRRRPIESSAKTTKSSHVTEDNPFREKRSTRLKREDIAQEKQEINPPSQLLENDKNHDSDLDPYSFCDVSSTDTKYDAVKCQKSCYTKCSIEDSPTAQCEDACLLLRCSRRETREDHCESLCSQACQGEKKLKQYKERIRKLDKETCQALLEKYFFLWDQEFHEEVSKEFKCND